eukprot:TRINITY_DN645_c0_g4_i1.p1 TRINITY_DN645_c0_g4~~TRINITY_DN645_c0_g4_i1.p1  ORF type:complete len:431 (+),score=59.05 TRINITY_DN645_c0_g4_i1:721-2013(+)
MAVRKRASNDHCCKFSSPTLFGDESACCGFFAPPREEPDANKLVPLQHAVHHAVAARAFSVLHHLIQSARTSTCFLLTVDSLGRDDLCSDLVQLAPLNLITVLIRMSGLDCRRCPGRHVSLLDEACRRGNLDLLKQLLFSEKSKTWFTRVQKSGNRLLLSAVGDGHTDIATFLMDNFLQGTLSPRDLGFSFEYVCEAGNVDAARWFAHHGGGFRHLWSQRPKRDLKFVFNCCWNGHAAVVRLLVAAIPYVVFSTPEPFWEAVAAASSLPDLATLRVLLDGAAACLEPTTVGTILACVLHMPWTTDTALELVLSRLGDFPADSPRLAAMTTLCSAGNVGAALAVARVSGDGVNTEDVHRANVLHAAVAAVADGDDDDDRRAAQQLAEHFGMQLPSEHHSFVAVEDDNIWRPRLNVARDAAPFPEESVLYVA